MTPGFLSSFFMPYDFLYHILGRLADAHIDPAYIFAGQSQKEQLQAAGKKDRFQDQGTSNSRP